MNGQLEPLSIAWECASSAATRCHTSYCVWPFDFYAEEMDIGFRKCRLELNKQHPVEQVFQDHFHVKFVKSMFYDHRHHWMSVSQSVRERYIGYGHTERGHWATFLRHEIKGERRMGHF